MRKYITPSCDCGLELDLVVEYEYSPFVAGRLTGPPEHCYPDEHESLVIESVYLIGDVDLCRFIPAQYALIIRVCGFDQGPAV